MRIMFDATSLARKSTGIENYTKYLLLNLLSSIESNDELIVLFRSSIPEYMNIKLPENIKFLISPFNSQLICEQIWIPFIKLKYKPDVIHFPAFPPPLLVRGNIFFTIHDATMWKYTDTLSFKNKIYMKPLSNLGVKKSATIFTVSESSKQELSKIFPNLADKIFNMGISIPPNIKKINNNEIIDEVKLRYKIPEKFILTVGSLEPRKNLIFLIDAFTKYCKLTNQNDLKLVITGRGAWGADAINSYIKEYKMEDLIILTGYVSDTELNVLYSICELFVFPSIYEGFGLPVLEAMACGAPVICSNTSSLPEVAGEAALYFNPYKKDELIDHLINASNCEIKMHLSVKGLERSQYFSWSTTAKNIYDSYKRRNLNRMGRS